MAVLIESVCPPALLDYAINAIITQPNVLNDSSRQLRCFMLT